jgi:phosphate transport system substrate-binding protein
MAQKNETPALLISLVITLALIIAGIWWLTQRSGINFNRIFNSGSGSSSPQTSRATGTLPSQTLPSASATFAQVEGVPSGLFSYGGSTTWAPIRQVIDPAIQTVWPDFRLRYTDPLSEAPGSGTGIRMLLNNQVAFSQSSRSLKAEEYQEAQNRGFKLQEIPVAIDGIAIAVNPNLKLSGLTLTQLKNIYTGKVANWNQVGGPNLKITPYSRQLEAGGTIEFFSENILGNQKFAARVQFIPTTTQALQKVAADPGGIYYASAPEVVEQCTVKALPLGRQASQLVPPYQEPFVPLSQCPGQRNQLNQDAFQSGQYPITRRLFVIVKQNGQADQQAGEAYAKLLLTNQGQELITKAGYVRIR